MNWLDILLLVIIVFNVFLGFRRGLIRSVFGLFAIILAIFVAVMGTPFLTSILVQFLVNEQISRILAFLIFFALTFSLVNLLGKMLHDSIKSPMAIPLNAFGGGILGFLKGIVIIIFLLVPLLQNPLFSPQVTEGLESSRLLTIGEPLIVTMAPAIEYMIKEIFPKWQIKKQKKEIPQEIRVEPLVEEKTAEIEKPFISIDQEKLKEEAGSLLIKTVLGKSLNK